MKNRTYTIAMVNYNKHKLTNAAIKSILKNINVDFETFIVVDNSDDGTKFRCDSRGITVLDNTNEKFCNLYRNGVYPSKQFSILKSCYGGDQYHSCALNKIIETCTTDFLIVFDCDILLKRSIDFLEEMDDYHLSCEYQFLRGIGDRPFIRVLPVFMVLNMDRLKADGITYYDGFFSGETFFFELIKNDAKIRPLKISDYCEHLWSGTWDRSDAEIDEYLKRNGRLWK